jgi:hypothetical protein
MRLAPDRQIRQAHPATLGQNVRPTTPLGESIRYTPQSKWAAVSHDFLPPHAIGESAAMG